MAQRLPPLQLIALLAACGCATITNGPTQTINVQTNPPGATCDVGEYAIRSPGAVVVKHGWDLSVRELPVVCRAPGYQDAKVALRKNVSGWLAGDVLTGILPGLLVDLLSGGAWYFEPGIVKVDMVKADGKAAALP